MEVGARADREIERLLDRIGSPSPKNPLARESTRSSSVTSNDSTLQGTCQRQDRHRVCNRNRQTESRCSMNGEVLDRRPITATRSATSTGTIESSSTPIVTKPTRSGKNALPRSENRPLPRGVFSTTESSHSQRAPARKRKAERGNGGGVKCPKIAEFHPLEVSSPLGCVRGNRLLPLRTLGNNHALSKQRGR